MFICFIAYGDINIVVNKVKLLTNKYDVVYIHYNKREPKKNFYELRSKLKKYNNVHVVRKYKIFWGHWSITKCQMYFIKKFLRSDQNYFLNLDNKTIVLNKGKIIKALDENIWLLNLNQENLMIGTNMFKDFLDSYKMEIILNKFHYKLHWKNKSKNNYNHMLRVIFFIVLENKTNLFKLFFDLYKKNFKILEKFNHYENCVIYKKKNNIQKIKYPFTFGANLAFSKDQLNNIIKNPKFKKAYKFQKNKFVSEEWFWGNFVLQNIKQNSTIPFVIALFKEYDKLKILNVIDKNKFLIFRYNDFDFYKVVSFLKTCLKK